MAEKRNKRDVKVPFVDAAAADGEASPVHFSAVPAIEADLPEPTPFVIDQPVVAVVANQDTAETATVDAEPAPAPAAAAPEPMAAAAAIPEAAPPAPATTEPAFLPPSPRAALAAVAPFLKGFPLMATAPDMTYATTAATDKFQSMFGDVNERAKNAVEKTSKIAEDITELTKGNVEAFVASGRVAAKGAEAMTQEVAEYSKKSFETATGAMKSFAAVKSPTELFQLQSEFAKSSFESMFAEASKVSESMLKLMGEIAQPLSSRYAVAAEKLKASASI